MFDPLFTRFKIVAFTKGIAIPIELKGEWWMRLSSGTVYIHIISARDTGPGAYSWRTPFCIFWSTHFVEMGSPFVDSVTRFVVLEQPFVDSVTHFVVLEQPDGKFYKLPLMRGKKPGTPQPHPSQNNDHPLLQLWLGWYHSVYCGTGCKHMMTYGLATRKSDFAPGTENGRKDSNVQ